MRTTVDAEGTVYIPAMTVPLSRYLSEQAKKQFIEQARKLSAANSDENPPIATIRKNLDDFIRPYVARAKEMYPVDIQERKIAGIPTFVITPKGGVSPAQRDCVLINLHGGGFIFGSGLEELVESIPVSSVAKIKVIAVDYRMAPEHSYPAANEDVASVYVELLNEYRPENIGIYGSSAGGILTAMTIAWFEKHNLPIPGAIGILAAGAFGNFDGFPSDPNTWGGDSRYMAPPLTGGMPLPVSGPLRPLSGAMNYTAQTDPNDPIISPALSPSVLEKFPPTLLMTGTRSLDMSAAAQTQRELNKAGIEANLHLWDGLGHAFWVDPELPESQEAYSVIAKFFRLHLGTSR